MSNKIYPLALKSVSGRAYVLMYNESEAIVMSLDEEVHTVSLCRTSKVVELCIKLHHAFVKCSLEEVAEQFEIISNETDKMFRKI